MVSEDERIVQLDTLVSLFGNGKKSQLARVLDVTDARVGMWYARKFLDVALIAEKLPSVSAEWLLRFKGEPIIEEQNEETEHSTGKATFHEEDTCYTATEEHTRLLDECKRLREDNTALREDVKAIRAERDMMFNKLMEKV